MCTDRRYPSESGREEESRLSSPQLSWYLTCSLGDLGFSLRMLSLSVITSETRVIWDVSSEVVIFRGGILEGVPKTGQKTTKQYRTILIHASKCGLPFFPPFRRGVIIRYPNGGK